MSDGKGIGGPLQPRTTILDVYGGFGREFGGWIPIASLVELMANFDFDPQAVRSATSRMKRRGLLHSEKVNGVAGYRLTANASQILEDGDSRIFRDPLDGFDSRWVIALFTVPEAERAQRYVIRTLLDQLGFAQDPAGAWFAPATVVAETRRMLERKDLARYVSLWRGEYLGFDDLSAVVAEAWDLPMIRQRYDEFIALADQFESSRPDSGRHAFVAYLRVLALWRHLPYLDPGLPSSVTPPDWPAEHARSLFTKINQQLRPLAMRYFVSVAWPP